MANIYFKCSCGKSLAVDEAGVGRTVNCPDCGKPIQIPTPVLECKCVCGKTMLAPESMAGEKVYCVECNEFVEIPAILPQKLTLKKQEPQESLQCPSCKANIKSDYILCINCGLDFRTGKKRKLVGDVDTTRSFPVKPIVIATAVVICGLAVAMWLGLLKGSKDLQVSPQVSADTHQVQLQSLVQSAGAKRDQQHEAAPNIEPLSAEKEYDKPVESAQSAKPSSDVDANRLMNVAQLGEPDWNQRFNELKSTSISNYVAKNIGDNINIILKDDKRITGVLNGVSKFGVIFSVSGATQMIPFTNMAPESAALLDESAFALYQAEVAVHKEMVKWHQKAADQGDARAQNNLGMCYQDGTGVNKDLSKAAEWYRKSAEQGFADAQYNLGVCYYYGLGVTQDFIKASDWLSKAAIQGNANAIKVLAQYEFNRGVCYELGTSVNKDLTKAAEWYRKAADHGHAMAQYKLGVFYQNGYGVTEDVATAIGWYRKAVNQGVKAAQAPLDKFVAAYDDRKRDDRKRDGNSLEAIKRRIYDSNIRALEDRLAVENSRPQSVPRNQGAFSSFTP